ncbi:MAG: hypothetical protein ACI83B_000549 [Sediminicola sp.]|jgi:hypothetical protein|tara:strand:+ start:2356 stop:2985 length:630 start_codon:yes stop_codon:yes gene_type:complete
MNRILVFLLITLSTLTVFGQNFEGQITYSNTYKSQNPKMTGQQWLKMMGDTQNYSIKNGNYKAISNGSMFQWLIYVNSENMLYTKMANSEIALWNDGMVNADTVLNAVVNKNVINILGYDCDELILTCKSGIQKYYFNTSLKVDISLFENHKFGNWYAFLKESNSLPLKMIVSNPQFIMESIATEVKEMKINESDLQLPENLKTTKSPY